MKATIIAGPYGAGKTTLIRNIRPSPTTQVLVAESSRLVPDRNRYGIDEEQVSGVSFGCVCCPDENLLNEAIKRATKGQRFENLLIEPPGNLDSRIVASTLLREGIELERVVTLVPLPHFQIEKIDPTFRSNLQNASVVAITKARDGEKPKGLEEMMWEIGSKAQIVHLSKDNPDLRLIYDSPPWSPEKLVGLESSKYHNHYRKYLQGISQTQSVDQVLQVLRQIASTGIVRAKGTTHGIEFDITHGILEINSSNQKSPGYFVGFDNPSSQEINGLIALLGPKKGEKIKYSSSDATPNQRLDYFYHLLSQSENLSPEVAGIVQAHFEPLDSAYHLADEILHIDKTDIPMRMILVPRIKTRIRALRALEQQESAKSPQQNIHATGAELASYTIQHTAIDKGRNFPEMLDASQAREIAQYVVPKYLYHLSHFTRSDRLTFPEYESMQGPYFLNMTLRAKPLAERESLKRASENMTKVNSDLSLADQWRQI